MEQQIYEYAARVLKIIQSELGADIGYDINGVQWLDKVINGQYVTVPDEHNANFVNQWGSYLGECIRQNYGGSWVEDSEYGWSVKFSDGNNAFPFGKVEKHLYLGKEESVLSFYTAIPNIFNRASSM